MRNPIVRLKICQMQAGLGGDAVRKQKSVAVGSRRVRLKMSRRRRFSANCFMLSFAWRRFLGLKSFILLTVYFVRCTIFVAARLLFQTSATLPRPPRFAAPGLDPLRGAGVNRVSSSVSLILQTADN
jgi:hypothetical protein